MGIYDGTAIFEPMNACLKCGEPTDGAGLCAACYIERAHHLHSIINSRQSDRPGRLLALGIAALLLSLLFAALLYDYTHATALDNASIHVQAMQLGQPLASAEYQLLSDDGLIAGHTDADGMVIERGISAGVWTLAIGCTAVHVEAAEVHGQVIQQVDASCTVWLPGTRR